jgi:GxxExxY protein
MTLMKEINEVVYKIIGSCMEVHKTLGPGHPAEYYKKALEIEMPQKGLEFEAEKNVDVLYKDTPVGSTAIDFLVAKNVILLIRCQEGLSDVEIQKVLRLISLTGGSIGVLVNFGLAKIQYKRVLPGYQQREPRKDIYRSPAYREIGKTREGNPVI